MEAADHGERQGAIPAKHFVNSRPIADHPDQRLLIRSLLLQPELDRLDGVRRIHGKMRLLVGLDQGRQYLQSISLRSPLVRSPKALDFAERRRVVGFSLDGFDLHIAPSSQRSCRTPYGCRAI